MIWLVQNAMFGDEFGYDNFIAAIDASGDRRIQLDYIFWEATIDLKLSDVTNPAEIIPFGTRSFVCYARKTGWKVFWNDAFEYDSLLMLGEEFVNYDMQVAPLDKLVVPDSEKIYIREAAGFNIIKGKVISAYGWPDWVNGFKNGTDIKQTYHDWHPITGESLFVCAPVKTILDEYRVWVVGRKVVSSSQYISKGEIDYKNTDENWEVNSYAQRIVDRFDFGMSNFVIDVFRTDQGLKVGEINCLHCSGWYSIDSRKVVNSLMEQSNAAVGL